MKKALWVLVLLLSVQHSAIATVFYVGKSGSNANSCATAQSSTAANRKLTIVAGISCMSPGDELVVGDGTYIETNVVNSLPNGTSWANVTLLRAENPLGVILRANNNDVHILHFAGRTFVEVRDLIADQGTGAANGALFPNGAHSNRLRGCEIRNIDGNQGVTIEQGANFNELINLNVHNVGPSGFEHGGYLGGNDTLIEGGEWHDNTGNGIQVLDSSGVDAPDRVIVRKVKFYNNLVHGLVIVNGVNSIAHNNVAWDNLIGFEMLGSNHKMLNNTSYSNTDQGVRVHEECVSCQVKNHLSRLDGTAITNVGTGTVLTTNLTATVNPFTLAPTDFSLLSGSAPIGFATTLTEFTTDFTGFTRTVPWDAGAYEFQSGGSPSITLLTPNGGESWTVGTTQTITWSSVSAGANVEITLDRGNDGTFEDTISASTVNDGSFDWTVTTGGGVTATNKIKIKDTGAATNDVSDAVFTIAASGGSTITVTEPASGGLVLVGATLPIRWTSTGVSGNVRIDISLDNGTTWRTIVASTAYNSADIGWVAEAPTSSLGKIRVVSLNDGAVIGTSAGNFRVGGIRTGFTLN